MPAFRTSEALQAAFRANNMDAILGEADYKVELDVSDCDDVVGECVTGIQKGIELYEQMLEVRKISGNENAGIYMITYDNYVEDDASAFFVGTEAGLLNMFNNLPK